MQALLLEELKTSQLTWLRGWLAAHAEPATLPDTYWLTLPDNLLNSEQNRHRQNCGPFCMALVLEQHRTNLRLELLIRARQSLHCSCIALADSRQRAFALAFWDKLAAALAGNEHGPQH